MARTKSLLSVFLIFSALSALVASSHAWSRRHGPAQPNLCQKCCSEGGPECAAVTCQCPTATPKPVSICEDCCKRNPSRPECAYTTCACSLTTKRPSVCEICCSDKASTLEICPRIKCDCSIFLTTTTARPGGGCTTCCGPERFTAKICKNLKCKCLAATPKADH